MEILSIFLKHGSARILPNTEVNTIMSSIFWQAQAAAISLDIARKTKESRKKDYVNLFRQLTYHSPGEMEAVQGALQENIFIRQMEEEAGQFAKKIL